MNALSEGGRREEGREGAKEGREERREERREGRGGGKEERREGRREGKREGRREGRREGGGKGRGRGGRRGGGSEGGRGAYLYHNTNRLPCLGLFSSVNKLTELSGIALHIRRLVKACHCFVNVLCACREIAS